MRLPPPPPSNVGIHMPLIHSQCTIFDNIDFWGAGNRVFITKCPNSFVQDCSIKRFFGKVDLLAPLLGDIEAIITCSFDFDLKKKS